MNKVSAIQMTSTPDVDENLQTVALLLKQASAQGSILSVLPEMFPIVGHHPLDKVKVAETFGTGPIQDFLMQQAKKYRTWIVAGTMPIKCESQNKVRAACLVFNDQGEIVARYDKMHLFDVKISDTESYQESATTEPGDSVAVIDTPAGKLGLSVCYDIRFPEMFRRMFNLGAEIISIPAAFTMKTGESHWELLARSRAVENFCYVIGACQTDLHKTGRSTYGHSMIINPWGEVIKLLEKGIGVITAEVNLQLLHQIRSDIPVANHQKMFFGT